MFINSPLLNGLAPKHGQDVLCLKLLSIESLLESVRSWSVLCGILTTANSIGFAIGLHSDHLVPSSWMSLCRCCNFETIVDMIAITRNRIV